MLRHVLAHNGGQEQAIVDHLATLARPGGGMYLVDVDLTAVRILDADPDLAGLDATYARFHRNRGNDLAIGLRLGRLLQTAGLQVVSFEGRYGIIEMVPGMRPPSWAAWEAMLADGVANADDVRRWEEALARMDAAPVRPTVFVPQFVALARRPAGRGRPGHRASAMRSASQPPVPVETAGTLA